ncbi:LRR receptor-like serine/threonine-protein kinase FEI 1 [Acorus gramineus]|uniref:LRR receptor-like serine/threonine-protein kinase FEI 1 n=2 Tax=Acorus TaxID=4464 RepID=A0AAV9AS87_ACOGR|nr:LRR receptor-like serine/threonine-protein kinase FEI 1 [Acorus gramineus]
MMGFVVWVVSALLGVSTFITTSSALSQDGETLLEIKGALNVSTHRDPLSDWRVSDLDPCNWTAITCHRVDRRVRSINLPFMRLGGIISPSIGKLARLQRLALHHNSLHGSIPPEISYCSELRAIYLRANYLQGSIPPELGNLTHLVVMNLSTNFLSGEVPNVGVLSTFKINSFVGNLDLCGTQVRKICRGSLGFPAVLPNSGNEDPPGISPVESKKSPHYLNGVLIGSLTTVGLALLVILSLIWVYLLSRKGRRLSDRYSKIDKPLVQDAGTKLISFHGNLPYTSHEIIKRLELLDEEDVIGSGGFGTVFKMVMDDSNVFSVKRIDRILQGSDQTLEKELELLGTIKHINLVNLRGYCRFPSTKLLIYDYLSLGSLDSYLHEHGQEEQPLNWNARLKIAIGSARGLAYLHHDCSPAIVHRNIKSSNILLDASLEPHVSDFGLAKFLVDDEAHVTTVVAGTFGYLAPEYLHSGQVTAKSDVYSFGVLLLELVTGKRPTDASFVMKGLHIVGWMNTLMGENRLEEIVDRNCDNMDVESVEAILDIASMCTNAEPEKRPTMKRVLQMLEEVMSPCPSDFYESHSE